MKDNEKTTQDDTVDEEHAARLRQIVEARVVHTIPGMDRVQVERNLSYTGDRISAMDVYRPADLEDGERRPAVLFVHGGPLGSAKVPEGFPSPKNWGTFASYGELAAATGLVGVVFNHRYLSLEALETSIADVQAALDYVREHADALGIDGERLALWFFSGAGLHLSLPLRERPEYLRCLVAFYCVLDFELFRSMGQDVPAEGNRFLPSAQLNQDGGVGPLLLARAGQDDPAINRGIDSFLIAALESGVQVDLLNHPQGPHGFDVFLDDSRSHEIVAHALRFLVTHLRDAIGLLSSRR